MYPALIRERCEGSLKRLQTDYIDLYMLHWPISGHAIAHFTKDQQLISHPPAIHEAFAELINLQKEGKIRHIGISNHGIQQMKELQDLDVPFVANEMAYNLFSRAIEETILPYCLNNSIGVIGYMPLQQGLLSGKYDNLDAVNPMQARSRHFHSSRGEGTRHGEEGAEAEINQALKEIKQLADELNVHRIVLSLAWIIANQGITSTIVGSRNEKQLDLNIQGAYYALKPEVIAKLNEISEPVLQRLGSNPDYYENRNNSRIS
jgi:myo-inositol catabolism protein IolS